MASLGLGAGGVDLVKVDQAMCFGVGGLVRRQRYLHELLVTASLLQLPLYSYHLRSCFA